MLFGQGITSRQIILVNIYVDFNLLTINFPLTHPVHSIESPGNEKTVTQPNIPHTHTLL